MVRVSEKNLYNRLLSPTVVFAYKESAMAIVLNSNGDMFACVCAATPASFKIFSTVSSIWQNSYILVTVNRSLHLGSEEGSNVIKFGDRQYFFCSYSLH